MGTVADVLSQYGGIIGSFIGASGPLLAGLILYIFQIKEKRKRIKIALSSELKSMDELDKWFNNKNDKTANIALPYPSNIFHTTIYEGLIGEIGLLNEKELASIHEFYSLIYETKPFLKIYKTQGEDESPKTKPQLIRQLQTLSQKRKETLNLIK